MNPSVDREVFNDLISECRELNQWKPVDDVPLDKIVLVAFSNGLIHTAMKTTDSKGNAYWFSADCDSMDYEFATQTLLYFMEIPESPK